MERNEPRRFHYERTILHPVEPEDFVPRLKEAMKGWLERHPTPDKQLHEAGLDCSARILVEEIENETEFGLSHINIQREFAQGDEDGYEGVIEMFNTAGIESEEGNPPE